MRERASGGRREVCGQEYVTVVVRVTELHRIRPCWKSLRRPSLTAYSSEVGRPSRESGPPSCRYLLRIAPRTGCAPRPLPQ